MLGEEQLHLHLDLELSSALTSSLTSSHLRSAVPRYLHTRPTLTSLLAGAVWPWPVRDGAAPRAVRAVIPWAVRSSLLNQSDN